MAHSRRWKRSGSAIRSSPSTAAPLRAEPIESIATVHQNVVVYNLQPMPPIRSSPMVSWFITRAAASAGSAADFTAAASAEFTAGRDRPTVQAGRSSPSWSAFSWSSRSSEPPRQAAQRREPRLRLQPWAGCEEERQNAQTARIPLAAKPGDGPGSLAQTGGDGIPEARAVLAGAPTSRCGRS